MVLPVTAALILSFAGAGADGCGGEAVVDGGGGEGGSTTSSGTGAATTSSSTSSGTGGCTPFPTCPAQPPAPGSSCVCEPGLKCAYDLCAETGEQINATCNGSSWQVEGAACTQVWCPNNIPCDLGEVCLIVSTGFESKFECVPNPCPPEPLSCECAAVLCGADPSFACISAQSGQVTCECIVC